MISGLFLATILVSIALVASAILGIFHIEGAVLTLDVDLWDAYFDESVESLFFICGHLETSGDFLAAVDSYWFGEEKECLIPMSRLMIRSRMQYSLLINPVKKRAKV